MPKPLPEKEKERPAIFYVKRFLCEPKNSCNGSLFKVLMVLGPNKTEKCVASNGEHILSLKAFDNDIPHPDTMFLITKV